MSGELDREYWGAALRPPVQGPVEIAVGKSALQSQVDDLTGRVAALEARLAGREVSS